MGDVIEIRDVFGEDLLTSRAQRGARFGALVATLAEQVKEAARPPR